MPPAWSPGRLKKRAFDETLSRGPVSGLAPTETVLFCCLTKLCIIPPSMTVKKKTVRRSLDMAGNAEGTMTKYLAFARGGRMAQPEADRRPLRLRAMPPGRLRRKRQNPHHAGRHNNRAGPCGRVRRLRSAVVGGMGGQRSSMTTPDIGWHYSRMEGAVTLLSGGPHTSSVCTSWTTATRAHCE